MQPPSDLPWPSDRPVHGSKSGPFDQVLASISLGEVSPFVIGLKAAGYHLAWDIADFYLSDPPEGSSYNVQTPDVERVVQAKPKVDADDRSKWQKYDKQDLVESAIHEILSEAYHNAEYSGKYGEQQSIAPDWMPAGKLYGTGDLENALGGFHMTVGADITVLKAQQGQPASYTMSYRAYIFDLYMFHGTASTWYGEAVDRAMRNLEEAGRARSFITRGASDVRTREGRYGS